MFPLGLLLDQYAVELDLDEDSPVTQSPPSPTQISSSMRKLAFDAVHMSNETLSRQAELRRWQQWQRASAEESQKLHNLYQEELANSERLSAQLSGSRRDMSTLQARHLACLREVQQLRDCVGTLHTAHKLDASINSLLIDDQECEIEELKRRLGDADRHRQLLRKLLQRAAPKVLLRRELDIKNEERYRSSSNRRMRTREQGSTYTDVDTSSDAKVINGLVRRVSSRNPVKRRQLARLQKSRKHLLDAYQRRNSTTLENVVRRTSQMSIASATAYSDSPVRSTD